MANDSLLNTPVLWINKYLQAKLGQQVGIGVPFFPTMPSTLDALTDQWLLIPDETNDYKLTRFQYAGVMSTWDRMIRMNRKSFPHIKSEQVLYYFYATADDSITTMIKTTEQVYRLLGRADESAEELNNWCSNRRINIGTKDQPELIDNMFYFHNLKVYQLEEVRDIIDFGTARTYAGNKIIVDFEYHQMPDLTNNNWSPEILPPDSDKITL